MKRDPEARKARILAAAAIVFARDGYGGGRVDTIAQQAGVNKRMLYHYFGDKAALFEAVIANQLPVFDAFVRGGPLQGIPAAQGVPAAQGAAAARGAAAAQGAAAAPSQRQLQTLWRLLAWDALRPAPAASAQGLRAILAEAHGAAGQREAVLLGVAYSVLQHLLPAIAEHLGGVARALNEQLETLAATAKPRVRLAPVITPSGTASSRK